LEEELNKIKKENEQLSEQLKSDAESSEKNLMSVKKQADLRMASIKKQYENESQSKLEELNSKNYELELKLKEKNNLIEIFKSEGDSFSVKLSQLEDELSKKFESEKLSLQEEYENKIKHYEDLLDELNNKKIESENDKLKDKEILLGNLRKENEQLNRKLEDLRIAHDELVDEKTSLVSSISKAKSDASDDELNRLTSLLKEKERIINDLELKMSKANSKSVYEDSLGYVQTQNLKHSNTRSLMAESSDQDSLSSKNNFYNHCLEATEIDYLRQIIYSYMMGVDPVVIFFY
jgi:chromosome segregation ATPase